MALRLLVILLTLLCIPFHHKVNGLKCCFLVAQEGETQDGCEVIKCDNMEDFQNSNKKKKELLVKVEASVSKLSDEANALFVCGNRTGVTFGDVTVKGTIRSCEEAPPNLSCRDDSEDGFKGTECFCNQGDKCNAHDGIGANAVDIVDKISGFTCCVHASFGDNEVGCRKVRCESEEDVNKSKEQVYATLLGKDHMETSSSQSVGIFDESPSRGGFKKFICANFSGEVSIKGKGTARWCDFLDGKTDKLRCQEGWTFGKGVECFCDRRNCNNNIEENIYDDFDLMRRQAPDMNSTSRSATLKFDLFHACSFIQIIYYLLSTIKC